MQVQILIGSHTWKETSPRMTHSLTFYGLESTQVIAVNGCTA